MGRNESKGDAYTGVVYLPWLQLLLNNSVSSFFKNLFQNVLGKWKTVQHHFLLYEVKINSSDHQMHAEISITMNDTTHRSHPEDIFILRYRVTLIIEFKQFFDFSTYFPNTFPS